MFYIDVWTCKVFYKLNLYKRWVKYGPQTCCYLAGIRPREFKSINFCFSNINQGNQNMCTVNWKKYQCILTRGVAWVGALAHARHPKKKKRCKKKYYLYPLLFIFQLNLLFLLLFLSNFQKVNKNFEHQLYKIHLSGA